MRKQNKLNKGMTLVEVMVASAVLLFGLMSSFIALNAGYVMIDLARCTTISSQIMQSEFEDIRLKNWASLPSSGDVTIPYIYGNRFSATRTVSDYATDIKQITVTVEWRDITGKARTRSYRMLYTRNGLNDYFYTSP